MFINEWRLNYSNNSKANLSVYETELKDFRRTVRETQQQISSSGLNEEIRAASGTVDNAKAKGEKDKIEDEVSEVTMKSLRANLEQKRKEKTERLAHQKQEEEEAIVALANDAQTVLDELAHEGQKIKPQDELYRESVPETPNAGSISPENADDRNPKVIIGDILRGISPKKTKAGRGIMVRKPKEKLASEHVVVVGDDGECIGEYMSDHGF
jgi:hypothetical protein